jgi:3-isopropylmalate/(R)-2-methylmalate dehydratase small subunit
MSAGSRCNDTTGDSATVAQLPDLIFEIIESDRVMPRLAAQGYLPR